MAANENLVDNLEKALKANINILLSSDMKLNNTQEGSKSLTDANANFENAIMKMKSYFIQSKLLGERINPEKAHKEQLEEMQEELGRKDNLIKEQVKKLSRYRVEIEVLQEAQVQAQSKNF